MLGVPGCRPCVVRVPVLYGYDQKYGKKGESRSKHRGAERVDAQGRAARVAFRNA